MKSRGVIIAFILGIVVFAFGSSINHSIFNNYLADVFDFTADQRGGLEIPRELPGLLVTLTIGAFFFLSELRLLGFACLTAAVGMLGVGIWSPSVTSMLWWVFVFSTGIHVQMVLLERVALELGIARGAGHRLGRVNGLRSLGMILGALFVTVFAGRFNLSYSGMFKTAAVAMTIGALIYLLVSTRVKNNQVKRSAFVYKKRYNRYFVLAALFGIRKQIFITFAPWFLVRILDFKPQDIARVVLVSAALGIFVKPLLGRMIDRFGERNVLVADGIIIAAFCLGYVIFPIYFTGSLLIFLCCTCFVLDELMFTLRTARTTWLMKIAEKPEDVTGTMSASVSVDHVLSMSISWIAGLAWLLFGYQVVFLFCTLVALSMTIVSAGIRIPAVTNESTA